MPSIRLPRNLVTTPHFAALSYREYRYTWCANMLSGAAMWTLLVATGWLALEESNSSGWVGIIAFSSMLPFLVVSPIGGLMADRFDRRSLALWTLTANSLTLGVLATLVLMDAAQLWQVAVFVFLSGSLRAILDPTMQALIPNQVPRRDLLNAFTLGALSRHGAKLVLLVASPLLAVEAVGVEGVLIMSAGLQVAGAAAIALVRTASRGESGEGHGLARGMVEGLVHIYTNRAIALFVLLAAFHCALVMSFDAVLPVLSQRQLGAVDGSILGYLVLAFGVGSALGLILMAGVRDEARKGQFLMYTAAASGLTPMILAVAPNVPVAVLASAGMGASQATFMALTNTYVQTVAPDRLRGRIGSLYTLHAGGVMAFSNLGFGFVADAFSAPPILIVASSLYMIVLIAISAGQPVLRRVYRTGEVMAA